MAVGDYLFRLLKANATVDVERGVPALAGGTQYTWTATYAGVLTTRTDASTGVLTMAADHWFFTGDTLDVFWTGGSRLGMTATVAASAVTVGGGSGDDLPALSTALTAKLSGGVNVLVTQAAGSRDLANGVFMQRDTYTVAGVDPRLARSDVRFKVVTAAPGLAMLVDRYLMPTAGVGHSQGVVGILGARINRGCVLQEIEANDGSEL